VNAAKSGGQEVRVGDVFVECAKKTGFPGFEFSGGVQWALGGAKKRLQKITCTSGAFRRIKSWRLVICSWHIGHIGSQNGNSGLAVA